MPRLSPKQERVLPKDYIRPFVEGMCIIDDEHLEGLIILYVGYCDWERDFDHCVKEFVLTVFHEMMHFLFSDIDDYVPYAERVLADILYNK